ncbi:MAG: ABC transporter permease [Bacteroidota bacterium]
MLFSYLKTSFRFFTQNLSFTLINLIGLTSGITAFIIIMLYIQEEVGYDDQLTAPERTWRMVGIQEPQGLKKQHVAISSAAWHQFIMENIPAVEDVFRVIYPTSSVVTIESENQSFRETNMYASEGNILKHLGYPVLHSTGNDDLLNAPNKAVISKKTAERFFDQTNVTGKLIKVDGRNYTITGVYDNTGVKTHLKIDLLLSLSTIENESPYFDHFGNNSLTTYIVTREGTNPAEVEQIINQKQINLEKDEEYRIMKTTFYLQKVKEAYLRSGNLKFHMNSHQGNIRNVFIFLLVSLFILAIASINFINLSTANASKRAKEIGLRKVLGAERKNLILQFMFESLLLTFISIIMALAITELILPYFNQTVGSELSTNVSENYLFPLGLLLVFILVGGISGFYPAIYLSKFQPAQIIGSQKSSARGGSVLLRRALVILQFAISAGMLLATAVVMHQTHFMNKKNLGYNADSVLSVFTSSDINYQDIITFQNRVLNLPESIEAGVGSNYNGVAGRQSSIHTTDSIPTELMVRFGYVNPDFFPAMEIPVIAGRNFSYEFGTDPKQAIIINRATQQALGWENPVGKRFRNEDYDQNDYFTVIGVIEDYHYYSLKNPVEPAVYIWDPDNLSVLNIKFSTQSPSAFLQKVENEYQQVFPGKLFHSRFISDILLGQYTSERKIMNVFMAFAILCIPISCLGLLGLTSFIVNQRRKEISVRKVLGSSTLKINMMLVNNFLRWVFLACLISLPFTYFLLDNWLNGYPYRIEINIYHFAFSAFTLLAVAFITVITLSTKAARQNPAENLNYE